jgi:hypothetical protein
MREFDYFASQAQPVSADELARLANLPEHIEAEIELSHKEGRKAGLSAITATLVMAACTWFLWGYRDSIAYSFSRARPPLQLGDVVELTPADIPHNAYVELEGITEHRGLTQKITRALWPVRDERWYFRLVGSRGVFIETAPDSEHYGFATRMTIRGRAVDPERSALYADLLNQYRERFSARASDFARIIEVDVEPGTGRLPYLVFAAFIGAVAALDCRSLLRYARHRRKHAGIMR